MELVTNLLSNIFKSAFFECGYDEALGQVVVSNRLDLCQFQCNGALAGAKKYRKSPLLIAKEVAAHIPENEMIGSLEVVAPGFINISLKDEFLMEYVQELYFDKYMGVPQADKEETIVLDYGNPNVAKPLHVGHLRSAIIGEALKRIITATGRKAIGDVHLGDWDYRWAWFLQNLKKDMGIIYLF